MPFSFGGNAGGAAGGSGLGTAPGTVTGFNTAPSSSASTAQSTGFSGFTGLGAPAASSSSLSASTTAGFGGFTGLQATSAPSSATLATTAAPGAAFSFNGPPSNAAAASPFGLAGGSGLAGSAGTGISFSTGGFSSTALTTNAPTAPIPAQGLQFGNLLPSTAPATVSANTVYGGPNPNQGGVLSKIDKIQRAYAPAVDQTGKLVDQTSSVPGGPQINSNEQCKLQTLMYNKKTAHMQQSSQHGFQEDPLLQRAEMDDVDLEKYEPVVERGTTALKKRFEFQQEESNRCIEHAKQIRICIANTEAAHGTVASKFDALKMRQIRIYQQLLGFMRKIEVLRCHGMPLQHDERHYRARLNELLHRIAGPHRQLQELCTSALHQQQSELSMQRRDAYANIQSEEDNMQFFLESLRKQREGLEYVTDILAKDLRDINIIAREKELFQHNPGVFHNNRF